MTAPASTAAAGGGRFQGGQFPTGNGQGQAGNGQVRPATAREATARAAPAASSAPVAGSRSAARVDRGQRGLSYAQARSGQTITVGLNGLDGVPHQAPATAVGRDQQAAPSRSRPVAGGAERRPARGQGGQGGGFTLGAATNVTVVRSDPWTRSAVRCGSSTPRSGRVAFRSCTCWSSRTTRAGPPVQAPPRGGPARRGAARTARSALELATDDRPGSRRSSSTSACPTAPGSTSPGDLRAKRLDVPILILTARDTVGDRVTGLDAGADDYLVKPFAFEELAARLRALARGPAARGGRPGPAPGRADRPGRDAPRG